VRRGGRRHRTTRRQRKVEGAGGKGNAEARLIRERRLHGEGCRCGKGCATGRGFCSVARDDQQRPVRLETLLRVTHVILVGR
jgi:hypothetical protein